MLIINRNNNGFSLIEIIISVALLSIIAATFLQIFSGSFEKIMNYGRENIAHYKAGGELEIAISDETYTGNNENVLSTDATIEVFTDEYVTTSFIQSKSNDITTKLEYGDQYLFAYAEKKGSYDDEAFIDENDNALFDEGEQIISSDDLESDFFYEESDGTPKSGVLIIPYTESLNREMTSLNWRINDGVVIKRGVNINVTGDVQIDITDGNIEMNSIVFESGGSMNFYASGIIESQSSAIIAKGSSIDYYCNDVYLNGFSSRVTIIDSPDINFDITDTIYMNQYTFFYDDASLVFAEKNEGANLNIANDINDTDNNEFN